MSITAKLKTKAGNFKETRRRTKYARYYKHCKVNPNIIVYDSYFGRGLVCNPYAIFLELVNNEEFADYTHVWILEDLCDNEIPLIPYRDNKNVLIIQRHSDAHLKYLASAGYIFANVSLPFYYCKKPGQVYINTWHGTPIKSLGYDIPGAAVNISNVLRNFLSTDYLISGSPFLTSVYKNQYKLDGIFEGTIIEEGYPRNDSFYRSNREEIISKLTKFVTYWTHMV